MTQSMLIRYFPCGWSPDCWNTSRMCKV